MCLVDYHSVQALGQFIQPTCGWSVLRCIYVSIYTCFDGDRWSETQINRWMDRQAYGWMDGIHYDIHKYRKTCRKIIRKLKRQTSKKDLRIELINRNRFMNS